MVVGSFWASVLPRKEALDCHCRFKDIEELPWSWKELEEDHGFRSRVTVCGKEFLGEKAPRRLDHTWVIILYHLEYVLEVIWKDYGGNSNRYCHREILTRSLTITTRPSESCMLHE